MQLMWTLSDDSDEFCKHITTTGLHIDMLENLRHEALSVDSLNNSQSNRRRLFVESHVNILHNVVRRVKSVRANMRKRNAIDVLNKFGDVTEHPVIHCLLIYLF